MKERADNLERDFDRLLSAYRDACQAPEPSPEFIPMLWARIENGRSWTTQVWKWANGFVAAAAAASLFLVLLQMLPRHSSDFYGATYLETLADHDDDQALGEVARVTVPAAEGPGQELPKR
ncbi:MAG: hypothetical protein HY858_00265 [Candidatus Solibacter usitatus]|nr:hypothetical protein [Candidatus Solibacter usitatus]